MTGVTEDEGFSWLSKSPIDFVVFFPYSSMCSFSIIFHFIFHHIPLHFPSCSTPFSIMFHSIFHHVLLHFPSCSTPFLLDETKFMFNTKELKHSPPSQQVTVLELAEVIFRWHKPTWTRRFEIYGGRRSTRGVTLGAWRNTSSSWGSSGRHVWMGTFGDTSSSM